MLKKVLEKTGISLEKEIKHWSNLKKDSIISGGISKERISLDTGKQVAKELQRNGYRERLQSQIFNKRNYIF